MNVRVFPLLDDDPSMMSYVDLTINPERYTGYGGHSAHRVWKAVYEENCFRYTPTHERIHHLGF